MNAAITDTLLTAALEVEEAMLRNAVNVNLMAPVNIIQRTAKKMIIAVKQGSIVNVSR